jgi:hypothetical protein
MRTRPPFREWFKVTPLDYSVYRATLLPSAIQLSQEYKRELSYP